MGKIVCSSLQKTLKKKKFFSIYVDYLATPSKMYKMANYFITTTYNRQNNKNISSKL